MNTLWLEFMSGAPVCRYELFQDEAMIGKGTISLYAMPEWLQLKIAVIQAFEGHEYMPGVGQRCYDRRFTIDVEPGEVL